MQRPKGVFSGNSQDQNRVMHMGLFTKTEPPSDESLKKALRDAVLRIESLEDRIDALSAQHLKLRGRVYAIWGREDKAASEPNQKNLNGEEKLSREELRRKLTSSGRFVPGRPPIHQE